MTDDNTINPTFFEFVAQVAHLSTTYALTLTTIIIGGWWGLLAAAVGVLAYATWHEFVWDPKHENKITAGSAWLDWGCLVGGAALAAGVALLVRTIK